MFVPSDRALTAVTSYDKTLWQDAFNSKVFIASERHLLMLIEMVNVMWVQQQYMLRFQLAVTNIDVFLRRKINAVCLHFFEDRVYGFIRKPLFLENLRNVHVFTCPFLRFLRGSITKK